MPDAYCRSCHASFPRPLPAPYGGICPNCIARGHIVTLTDVPRNPLTGRDRIRGDIDHEQRRRAAKPAR